MSPTIVAAADDFVILNKPAGLLVHATTNQRVRAPLDTTSAATLADWLIKNFPQTKKVGDDPKTRPGIIHRLDRAASGLMVVALTSIMFSALKKQFKEHAVTKEYLVLVHGKVKNDWGEIKLPIMRQRGSGRMAARPIGDTQARPAHTEYYVEQRFGNATLLRMVLRTGRTHQIRVHFFSLGHPVVGDTIYQARFVGKNFPTPPRLFLHATRLAFTDLQNRRQEFTVKLPIDLANYLKNFKSLG